MHPVVVFPLLPKISESYQAFLDAALKFCRDYTDDVYFVQHDNFQEILNYLNNSPLKWEGFL